MSSLVNCCPIILKHYVLVKETCAAVMCILKRLKNSLSCVLAVPSMPQLIVWALSRSIAHFDTPRGKILCRHKPHDAMRKNFATRPLRIWKPKEEKAARRAVRFSRSGICPIMFPPFLTWSARFNWTFFVARARIGTHAPQLPPRHLPTFTLSREIWPVYLNWRPQLCSIILIY